VKNIVAKKQMASMTVEAAFVLPLFLFAMLLLGYLAQMARYQDRVMQALTSTAREISAEYGAVQKESLKSRAYCRLKLEQYLGSSGSVSLLESKICEENDEIDLVADYTIKLPFHLLSPEWCRFRARVHTRAFTGVENRGKMEEETDERDVYITESGRVYHDSLTCTYLKLSISQLKFCDVEAMRNESGGTYKPCEKCCKSEIRSGERKIWITNYGDRYHVSRSCSGLKRNIRTIKRSETGSRTPCSKCVKDET
jgi:hypothetical protein